MPDSNFDSSYVNLGTGLTASVTGKPNGGAPILALVSALNKGGTHGNAPDGTWTASPSADAFTKVLGSNVSLNVSQAFGLSDRWVQMLAFFGSNGAVPVLTQMSSASTSNPGNGASRVTGPMAALPAGRDLILFMYLHANNGFFLGVETYQVFDSVGNAYTFLGEVHNLDGAGNGCQLVAFHCANALAAPVNWNLTMQQLVGDAAASVGLDYFFYSGTNFSSVKFSLLASLGVGT